MTKKIRGQKSPATVPLMEKSMTYWKRAVNSLQPIYKFKCVLTLGTWTGTLAVTGIWTETGKGHRNEHGQF